MKSAFGLVLLVALFSAGCASSPPVNYYALQAIETASVPKADDPRLLGVGPIALPGYLERPQLVTRQAGGAVHFDEFNRWAEPLEVGIPQTIATNLDTLEADFAAIAYPYNAARTDLRLIGRIVRFDGDSSGSVVLDVQWEIIDDRGDSVIGAQRSRFEAAARGAGDPASVVIAHHRVLEEFSREVASRLE